MKRTNLNMFLELTLDNSEDLCYPALFFFFFFFIMFEMAHLFKKLEV